MTKLLLTIVLLLGTIAAQPSQDFQFDVVPTTITQGETAVLRWSVKGATKVTIQEVSGPSSRLRSVGTFAASGSLRVSPTENTTYVISCEGTSRVTCASVSLRVQKRDTQKK